MSIGGIMKKPGWWPVRRARRLAEQAEAARDKGRTELIEPLRQMRAGDYLTPAIAEEIRHRRKRPG